MATKRAALAPAPVTMAVEVITAPPARTLDDVFGAIDRLVTVVHALAEKLTPALANARTPKIATVTAKTKTLAAPRIAGSRTTFTAPVNGDIMQVGDRVQLPASALKGRHGMVGTIDAVVLHIGTRVARQVADMPVACRALPEEIRGCVLTLKVSATLIVWAWRGDPDVRLTGKRVVVAEVVA